MLLEFSKVTGTNKGVPLYEVSFSLEEGYLMVLVGKNGAGKTTLLKTLMKDKKDYMGNILFEGKDIHQEHAESLENIAYIADEVEFFMGYTANQNVALLSNCYRAFDQDKYHDWMKRFELSGGKILSKMSRGEFIKFQMAFAIAHSPSLYLIDEATAGMDIVFCKEFHRILRELLKEERASVILTTHNEEEVYRIADYIGVMEGGRLVSFKENL